MAGTLTIGTLSDGTNSTSATNCIQGSAKAWVNFNGTGTVAIRASHNVSSITDNGTGDYTVNFTTAMADANYSTNVNESFWIASIPGQASGGNSGAGVSLSSASSYTLKSTTQLRLQNTTGYDMFDVNVVIFR